MAKEVAQAHNTEHEGSEHEQQTPGPGVQALQALLAKGRPEPKKVVKIIDAYRGERDALMALLHRSLGNAYVQQVVQSMHGLRADKKRLEVTAGDPGDPNAGSLVANKEGAAWRTADGDFTGTANKNGLDATYQIDANDAIHADVDAKKKTGTIGWEHDGETQGELYGDWSENDRRQFGLRRNWELENGGTVSGGIRNVTNQNPHHELPYLDGTMYGAPSGDRRKELDDLRRAREDGNSTQVFGAYTNGNTTVDAGIGVSGGELAGSANVRTQLGANDNLNAGIRHDQTGSTVHAQHAHTFRNGGTLTSQGWLHHGDEGTTGQLGTAYRDTNTQLDASYTRGTNYSAYHFGARQQLDKERAVNGSLDHVDYQGTSQTRAHLGGSYTSPRLVSGLDIDAGAGERDYLGLRGSMAAELAPNWYGSAFGGSTFEAGQQATGHLGASLTFTPSQKAALTLAGVLDQDGSLETRLQLDVFKDRVSNVSELSKHQRDALFSIFLSYSQGGDPARRTLDDRFGGPDMNTGFGQSGTVQAGIRIKF